MPEPQKHASKLLPYSGSSPEVDGAALDCLLSQLKQSHLSSLSQIQAFERQRGINLCPMTPSNPMFAGDVRLSPMSTAASFEEYQQKGFCTAIGAETASSTQIIRRKDFAGSSEESVPVSLFGADSAISSLFGAAPIKELQKGDVMDTAPASDDGMDIAILDFSLRDPWNSMELVSSPTLKRNLRPGKTANLNESVIHDEQVKPSGLLAPFISVPYSSPRLAWDLSGMVIFAVGDLIVLPLTAFPLNQDDALSGLNCISAAFWTVDLLLNFTAGYTEGGHNVLDTHQIAWRYIRTWFFIDLVVVIVEWLSVILTFLASSGSDIANYGSLLKVLKAGRMLRLIRFLKVKKNAKQSEEHVLFKISSEHSILMLSVFKIVAFIILLCHELACLFYFIGDSTPEGSTSWIDEFGSDDVLWLYSCSWHWSVTQFTAASTNVHPMNTAERIFNMVVVLVGMLVFSGVISSLTNSLMTLRKLWEEDAKKFSMLRRFLRQQKVPNALVARIVKYIEYQMSNRTTVLMEDDVEMLQELTIGLRKELNYAIRIQHLAEHPLFGFIDEVTSATIHRLTSDMETLRVAAGDELFFHQDLSECMYITVRGEFKYFLSSQQEFCVHQKEWLCEAALWMKWVNMGDLEASTESELLRIFPVKFGEVAAANPNLNESCIAYGTALISQLRDLRILSDVFHRDGSMNDLIDYRYQELVLKMTSNSRSVPSLEEWSRNNGKPMGRTPTEGSHSMWPWKRPSTRVSTPSDYAPP